MKIKKTIIVYLFIFFAQLLGMVNFAMSEEYYLIGTANYSIEIYSLNERVLKLYKEIKLPEISGLQWPNYNRVTRNLYFEGIGKVTQHRGSYIYKYNPDSNPQFESLLEGRYPALSPDGKWLTYYRHPGHLGIYNLENDQTKEIADDMYNAQPPVWISNNRMLYYSMNNQLMLLDISTGEKRMTGYEKIIPGALSPDGKSVLCGTFDGKKIILYSINDNKVETIYKHKLSIATSFIWCPDGRSFLFNRQTWIEQLKFREGGALFRFSLKDGTAKDLMPWGWFSGGVVGDFEKWK